MNQSAGTAPCPPVLLLGFNRPDLIKQTILAISAAAPERLYVACDGARSNRKGEAHAVASVRAQMLSPGWNCTVQSRFLESNCGCMEAVSGAIDWFFEHESAGIILEDDCVPEPSFFPFTAELLERYAANESIAAIHGNTMAPPHWNSADSYSFTRYPQPWGWATWRRAWAHFERSPAEWQQALESPDFIGRWFSARAAHKWRHRLTSAFQGKTSSWVYRWHYTLWRHQMLAVNPMSNLITNIGVASNATHTKSSSPWANLPTRAMAFPLRHPKHIIADDRLDQFLERRKYKSGPLLARHFERMRWKLGLLSLEEARGWHEKQS